MAGSLSAIDSPGHAKHHLGLLDSGSGLLFAGDAVGVRLPDGGGLRPATPPPDFDLELALDSLRRFADHRPAGIALAHYGLVPVDPQELLGEAETTLRELGRGGRARRGGPGRTSPRRCDARFSQRLDGMQPERRRQLETLNGVHSNAAGLRRWLEQRAAPPRPSEPDSLGTRAGQERSTVRTTRSRWRNG